LRSLGAQGGPDTVELHDRTGVLGRLPAFTFNPHFDATIGVGDLCQLSAHADLLIATDYELHWPVQFVQNGDEFSVVSLDRPEPGPFRAGPLTIDAGLTDPSKYTVYSGFGLSGQLNATVDCGFNTPIGRVSLGFGVGASNVSLGWVNKTVHHVPLAGDRDLEVPPDTCGGVDFAVGPVSLGMEDCQYQTLSGGLFRATLIGNGGNPQGIAVSRSAGDVVHFATAPLGGPIRVSQYNYGATLTTKMVAGLLINVDPRPFLPYKKRPRITRAQTKAGVFTSAQRHADQVGPTLSDGSWRDGKNHWYDDQANPTAEPTDATTIVAQANANWIHDGQVAPTLQDGRWRVKSGNNPWRYPDGRLAPTPTAQQLANANELTKTDPSEAEPLPTPDDLHGWTYETHEGDPGGIAPSHADPASLLLDLPIQPPSTQPAVAPCPVPPSQLGSLKGAPIPGIIRLPSSVQLPGGAGLYGTASGGTSSALASVVYTVGAAGVPCQASLSQDGGLTVRAIGAGNPLVGVVARYSVGGISNAEGLSCPYVAQARAFALGHDLTGTASQYCSPPAKDQVVQLPTSDAQLGAAAVLTPVGISDPNIPNSGNPNDETVAVFTFSPPAPGTTFPEPQAISCTLPTAQRQICAASLAFFLRISTLGSRVSSSALMSMLSTLNSFVTG